jgi:hypothetical protein
MIYYYAHSGHKFGLDCVRRGVALIKALRVDGIKAELLVNDFRAGLVARELGVDGAVTIETILDVDAVAKRGDSVILDTPEDSSRCLERYVKLFASLFRVTDDSGELPRYKEVLLKPSCSDDDCIEIPIVDMEYFEPLPKEDRTIFFFGDGDYNKTILSNQEFFDGLDMELILGSYFFLKYEESLEQIFHKLHQPEEYRILIRGSSRVLTASQQCALEAKASKADVIYIRGADDSDSLLEYLKLFDIKIIDGFNKKDFLSSLKKSKKAPIGADKVCKALVQKLYL